jgi:hypothetical protein
MMILYIKSNFPKKLYNIKTFGIFLKIISHPYIYIKDKIGMEVVIFDRLKMA